MLKEVFRPLGVWVGNFLGLRVYSSTRRAMAGFQPAASEDQRLRDVRKYRAR